VAVKPFIAVLERRTTIHLTRRPNVETIRKKAPFTSLAGFSLFTLHAIRRLVYVWAISKQRPLDVSVTGERAGRP
jgi:hypothetical protein